MAEDPQKEKDSPDEPVEEQCFFRQLNVEFLIHELKDPLSVIEANAHLLIEQQSSQAVPSVRSVKSLQRILRSTRKARALLWDLLIS